MRAPLMICDIGSFRLRVADSQLNKKGHQGGLFESPRLMALEPKLPAGLSGAGYDDANNNYAYRDAAGEYVAGWVGGAHRR